MNILARNSLQRNATFLNNVLAREYYGYGEVDKTIGEYDRLIIFDPKSKSRFLIHPKYYYNLTKLYEEKE